MPLQGRLGGAKHLGVAVHSNHLGEERGGFKKLGRGVFDEDLVFPLLCKSLDGPLTMVSPNADLLVHAFFISRFGGPFPQFLFLRILWLVSSSSLLPLLYHR